MVLTLKQSRKFFGARMRFRHPRPISNLLPSDGDHPLSFSRWRVYVPEDVPCLTDYFKTAFDFSPQNLGIFLQWLLPGNVGYQGSHSSAKQTERSTGCPRPPRTTSRVK